MAANPKNSPGIYPNDGDAAPAPASGAPLQRRQAPVVLRCVLCSRCGRVHPPKPYLTLAEVAGFLTVSVASLETRRSRGLLPRAHRIGRLVRFDACTIAALFQEEV